MKKAPVYFLALVPLFFAVSSCKKQPDCPQVENAAKLEQENVHLKQENESLKASLRQFKNPENMTFQAQDKIREAQKNLDEASKIMKAVSQVQQYNANLVHGDTAAQAVIQGAAPR